MLTKKSTNSQEENLEKIVLDITWVLALFKKFSARYLNKWDSAIEGRVLEVANEWAERLAGLNGNQIKAGLDNWVEAWPPSCDEFKASCERNKIAAPYHRIREPNRLLESDSDKAHRKELAAAELKKIRSLMQ